jgi:uracil-DNA glycosylase family 4
MPAEENQTDAARSLRALFAGLEDMPLLGTTRVVAPPAPAEVVPDLKNCTACGRHRSRRHVIIGQVVQGAKLCIVGAGPQASEDDSGKAFQGERGELLDKMIGAMGLGRHEVSLLHVVKCFSPSALEASVQDAQECYAHLAAQLKTARPGAILAMGQSAAQTVVRSDNPITKLRGKKWDWDGVPVFVSYDPANLIQQPELKKEAWADLKFLMKEIGLK